MPLNVADRGDQPSGERIGRFLNLRRALALCFREVLRFPSRFSPRAFTWASAAFVRSLVSPASNSATAAIMVLCRPTLSFRPPDIADFRD